MFTADPVDLIVEGAEKLAAEDRCGWSTAALGNRMSSIAAARELLDAEMLRVTGQWDAAGGWGADGYLSPRAWLTDNTPVNSPAASRQVRNARHVQQFDATADALADGLITTAKVELLAEVAKGREELYVRDEQVLLEIAQRLSLRDLTTALRTWRHLADDELGTDDPGKGFERIGLHVSPTPLGSVLSGFLDPEGATALTNALDLLEPPDPQHGPDAPRSLAKGRGEGLVKLARFFLDARASGRDTAGDEPGARRAVPTVELVFTVDSLRGISAPALDDHRCDLAGFGSVPLDTIRRLAPAKARVGWITFWAGTGAVRLRGALAPESVDGAAACDRRARPAFLGTRGAMRPPAGVTCTTSSRGRRAAPPICTTSCSYVEGSIT
ncbi:MAG: DUF222 domain-containing protein [Acidimicrobiia bacterium]